MNIEASVTSLDCNNGVCTLTQAVITCTITSTEAGWHSPPLHRITRVDSGYDSNITINGLLSINNSGLTTILSFTATTDKNGTQVRCSDVLDGSSMTCTILISGMSLTVSYITNMYYHFKIQQVMLLQD